MYRLRKIKKNKHCFVKTTWFCYKIFSKNFKTNQFWYKLFCCTMQTGKKLIGFWHNVVRLDFEFEIEIGSSKTGFE